MSEQDSDLVRETLLGRREAYETLVRRHHVRILQLCISLLADRSKAEDAAQEVFLKAYASLDRFQGKSCFSTWIHRIATNHCLDLLRKEARQKTESLDALLEKEGERIRRLLLGSGDPCKPAEDKDLAARILSHLPEEQRAALALRETQGLSYQKIAEVMDCTVDSVKARLRRARRTLQEKLPRHFLGP